MYKSLKELFAIMKQSLYKIIPTVISAVSEVFILENSIKERKNHLLS